MSFFDKIKEIVTESDDDEYDDFYEDDKKDKSIGIAPPAVSYTHLTLPTT